MKRTLHQALRSGETLSALLYSFSFNLFSVTKSNIVILCKFVRRIVFPTISEFTQKLASNYIMHEADDDCYDSN